MAIKENDLIAYHYSLFDKDHFRIVKGISMLAVLAAYICKVLLGFAWLPYVEGVAGAVFVFCSGYGVSESYNMKRGLTHYWENKFLKVWIPSLAVMVIISLIDGMGPVHWVTTSILGLKGDVLYLVFGAYAAFWMMFQLLEKRPARIIGLWVIAVVAFAFMATDKAHKLLVCLMTAFPAGVLFSQCGWRYKIRNFSWKGHLLLWLLLAIPAAGVWVGALILRNIPYLGNALLSVAFTLSAILLLLLVYYGKVLKLLGILAPVGTISYALYLCYQDVFRLFMKGRDFRTLLVVLGLLALVSSVLTWLRFLLITWNKSLRRRKRTHIKGRM